ncbi:MAG TPA: tetratricopeptide repeat protein [Candidatus Binataceae bacterium]|nr:tetratricopeptide repeat protein [Candidatus Binataceae bacterium]
MATTRTTHRINRKELRQPDEFQTFIANAEDFLVKNLTQVLVSASIVLVAGALAVGIYYYEIHQDNLAGDAFYNAIAELNNKNYGQAATDFQKLADNYSNREVGRLARFYLGSAYFQDGQLDKARDALIAYAPDAKDDLFASMAYDDLGVIYEKQGDLKKAQGAYSQAAQIAGPQQTRAQLQLAQVMARQGDKAGAIAAYQSFLTTNPFSPDRQTVIEALAELGAAPPAGAEAISQLMRKPPKP